MKEKKVSTYNKKDFIRLDRNESYFFLNKKILDEIKNFDSPTISRYPEYEELKRLLASHCGSKPEKILLTNGAEQAIRLVIQTLFKKGDRILLPVPTFVAITDTLKSLSIKPKTIFYKEGNNKFIFPIAEVLSSINRKTKGIILCNPNNPLGSSVIKKEILLILNKSKKFKIPVIIDEVYSEFSGYSSMRLTRTYKNLIIIKSFSKEFAMAGLRLGHVIADKGLINRLEEKRGLLWPVNHFAVYTAKIILKHKSYFRKEIREVLKRKKEITSFLRRGGVKCYDTNTNFIIIKIKDQKKLIQNLKSHKILVSDVSKYAYGQKLLRGIIRIGVPSRVDMETVKSFFNC